MSRSEIFEVVKVQIYQIVSHLRGKELHETDNLTDLGADSLDIVEVVSGSMKQLNIKVPRTKLSMVDELSELLDLFTEAVAAKPTIAQAAGINDDE